MKWFDRLLCVSAGAFGIGIFVGLLPFANDYAWAVPLGVVALLVGLSTASFVAWRGR